MVQRRKSMKRSRGRGQRRSQSMRGGWPWDKEDKSIETTMNPMHQPTNPQSEDSWLDKASSLVSGTGDKVEASLISAQEDVTKSGQGFLNSVTNKISGTGTGTEPGTEPGTGTGTGTGTEEGTEPGTEPGREISKEEGQGIFSSFGFGGRRRHKSMKMKGGRHQDFGYNAAPVTDAVTAEPTYMIKGGRQRRRTCKKKRKCCKKSCKRRHRHHKSKK